MFFNPEKVPVKVYLSTDKDAPRLDRTAGSLQTILKACLITGYGDKEGAGWSLAFEDDVKEVKVFRPEISPHTDFYMKVSNDTGREATVQVLQNMTSVDDGELKLQCDTPFKYGMGSATSSKWAVIANGRSCWLFHETANRTQADKSGTWLYCGDIAKNTRGERGVYLHHTGGSWGLNDTDRFVIFETYKSGGSVKGKLLLVTGTVLTTDIKSLFDGKNNSSSQAICSPVVVMAGDEIYGFPAYAPSTVTATNYQEIISHGRSFINHSTATKYSANLYIPTDYWEY